jgi:hypothetical protein
MAKINKRPYAAINIPWELHGRMKIYVCKERKQGVMTIKCWLERVIDAAIRQGE